MRLWSNFGHCQENCDVIVSGSLSTLSGGAFVAASNTRLRDLVAVVYPRDFFCLHTCPLI